MLSITRVNAGQAGTYYTADDYYLQDVGEWHGELASALGYMGAIQEKDFQSLIMGVDPKERFTIQNGGKEHIHTAGVDLTFSAPKSVSIAGLVLDDKRIIQAHNKAVSDTLDYIEKHYANVRIKENGKVHTEYTGNMLAAKFQHISSRELDPQLHTHCLVLNFTAKENGDIRAMDFKEIYDSKMLLGQIYRSELACNIKELGYQIVPDSKGIFEIKGMPPELLKEFSTRSEQIKERFEELKQQFPTANQAELKSIATIDTRKVKDEPSMDELKISWDGRVQGINKQKLAHELTLNKEKVKPDINKIINRSINIATEHEAIAKRDDILRVATKISLGEYRMNELQKALDKNENIIKLDEKSYTTLEIANLERKIVDQVLDGRGKIEGVQELQIQSGIHHYEANKGFKLTDCQKKAVLHVFKSENCIIAIQGDAGTGKTTMLDVVRTIAEKENKEIVGLSFTGKAASEIEQASQIKSQTIANFIGSSKNLNGKLVMIDEASMLSIKDIDALLQRCDSSSKVVLIGDTKQLQTIGQGKIFTSLQEKGVIDVVRMSEVQRQKDPEYKDIVDMLGAKQIEKAFTRLVDKGMVHEISNRDERLANIMQDYLQKPKDTIIVTALNKDREELNQMIREQLKQNNIVRNNEVGYVTRDIKSLRGEEKFYAENYAVGNIVVCNKADIIGKAGAEAKILEVDATKNTIRLHSFNDNKKFNIDLKQHGSDLQLYTEKTKAFAEGDKILFLKNDKGLGVKNGQTGYITQIDNSMKVKMDNGKELQFNPNTQYKYIEYGYALTDYKSQGQTEKHVIYHADTNKGVNFNQAYVGITRGKETVAIYTNDKAMFLENIKKEQQKTTTLDYNLQFTKENNKEGIVISLMDSPVKINNNDKELIKMNEPVIHKDKLFER